MAVLQGLSEILLRWLLLTDTGIIDCQIAQHIDIVRIDFQLLTGQLYCLTVGNQRLLFSAGILLG
jgi:hypothetical protein